MLITHPTTSTLATDPHKRQAAELLVHMLQFQQIETYISKSGGNSAADYCADFIEKFAERTKAMVNS
jgi:hypothetical protein